ncbi:MAG: hypothetical protein IT539_04175 [Bradyrhizobiaceae bacterium]|nr:hypothetical protein [Bradyrhizobiaceae bacterium]
MRHFENREIVSHADHLWRQKIVRFVERTLSVLIVGVWVVGLAQYAYVSGIVQ